MHRGGSRGGKFGNRRNTSGPNLDQIRSAQNIWRNAHSAGTSGELPNRRKALLCFGAAGAVSLAGIGLIVRNWWVSDNGDTKSAEQKVMPKLRFGTWVENPKPLPAVPIMPCKVPKGEYPKWHERYGDEGRFKEGWKGWSGVITVWAKWCNPCIAELGFFRELHNKNFPIMGIQHRKNPERGSKTLGEFWDDGGGASLYFTLMRLERLAFPQYAMHESNIGRVQESAGVKKTEGGYPYPFNAIVIDGKVRYYTRSVWDDNMRNLDDPNVRSRINRKEEAEYRAKAAEFIAAATYLLNGQ